MCLYACAFVWLSLNKHLTIQLHDRIVHLRTACKHYVRINQCVQAHKSVDKDLKTSTDGHWIMEF